MLRHSFGFERAVPVDHIRVFLGHTSLATTQQYIDHLHPGGIEVRVFARSEIR